MKKLLPATLLLMFLSLADIANANQPVRYGVSSLILRPQNTLNLARQGAHLSLSIGRGLVTMAERSSVAIERGLVAMAERSLVTVAGRDFVTRAGDYWWQLPEMGRNAITNQLTRYLYTQAEDLVLGSVPENQIILLDPVLEKNKMPINIITQWKNINIISPGGSPIDHVRGGRLITRDLPFAKAPLSSMVVPKRIARTTFDIFTHGTRDGKSIVFHSGRPSLFTGTEQHINAQQLAKFLEKQPIYQNFVQQAGSKSVVRLIACHTASTTSDGSPCFAKELNDLIKPSVFAPTSGVWLGYPLSDLVVTPYTTDNFQMGSLSLGIPTIARWILFESDN